MKKTFLFLIICGLNFELFSQTSFPTEFEAKKRNCVTLGILQGGGSLVGADFEFLLTDQFGFQLGAGFIGFGGGLNYHFKPSIRSSFISLQYWNQGVGDSFSQNVIGPSFVFRHRNWFTFQLGMGAPLSRGPALPEEFEQPSAMLLYSIGAYIPY